MEAADRVQPDPRHRTQAERIRSGLTHLDSREAYIGAQEQQYRHLRSKVELKLLERQIRILLGKKTKKLVRRRARHPEFQLDER